MQQRTLISACSFEGKGLHTGRVSRMKVLPAPANSGIVFHRTDLGPGAFIRAVAENVTSTARSTTISSGEVSVTTIEHLMSALFGLGIDNAIIEINNVEVPILDGSSSCYIRAFEGNSKELEAERKFINIDKALEIKDEKTGSWVRIEPADHPVFDITVDFHSNVLGVQTAHWDMDVDYAKEIGVCRTFVFFHEIEYLFSNNLIKGGDVDNAIVIVEHPVSAETLERMSALFNRPALKITGNGYLDNLKLHFPNECGRHKMLDMLGDMSLVGSYLNAHITAFKPGHTINTNMAKKLRACLGQ